MVGPVGNDPTSLVLQTNANPSQLQTHLYGGPGRSRTYGVSDVTVLQTAATQPTVASDPYWSWLWVTIPADVNIAGLQPTPPP